MTYADLVTAYLDDPGAETLGPLRRAVRGAADGSEQHPWSVLRINDEYDMLRALDKVRDRPTCTDGAAAYFDVASFA